MVTEQELLAHLEVVTGLEPLQLQKLVDEVRAWYSVELATWVRRRHRELQRAGLRNREIFPRIRKESHHILVRPQPPSERQIRRMVYG